MAIPVELRPNVPGSTDVWLTGLDSSFEADECDFGEDSNGNPVGQVYVENTTTTHTYGNDQTFTLTL